MNSALLTLFVAFLKAKIKAELVQHSMRETTTTHETYVIDNEFCLSCLGEEEREAKDTFEEVHSNAVLKTDPSANLPSSFTICSSSQTTYGSKQTFFSLLGIDGNKWLSLAMQVHNQTSFYHGRWAQVKLPRVFAYQWVRSCVAVNSASGLLQWVVDGVLVENAIVSHLKDVENKPLDLAGKVVIGVWQDTGARQWRSDSWTSNQVTNLNIFSTTLTIEEMKQITFGGKCGVAGDYLAWNMMQWILKGDTSIETVDQKVPCTRQYSLNLYPTPFTSAKSCMRFCENLGSRSPALLHSHHWENLQRIFDEVKWPKAEGIWLALDDTGSENSWVDFYDQSEVNFTLPWAPEEPNGGRGENCAALRPTTAMVDFPCKNPNWSNACMCERTSTPYVRLRGLCSRSAVRDTLFQPINNVTDFTKLTLVGLRTSITYDQKEMTWVLNDKESNVTGAPYKSFTLGRQNWSIKGDHGCSRGGKEYTAELKMSGCQEGNFTCNDGQCVSMSKRCNQLHDCRDESDEDNCKVLVLKVGYNKKIPPFGQDSNVNVSVSINFLRVVDIAEEDYRIENQFEMSLMWKDSRVTFQNLKLADSLNALSHEDMHKLWLPKVVYENTDQKESTRLGTTGNWEWETRIVARKEVKHGTLSGLQSIDEAEIFEGSENSLMMNQTYTHGFQCNFQLSYYPFDTQVPYNFSLTFRDIFSALSY